MIYAVVIKPSNRVRGYYTEQKMAQEHCDFINNHKEGSFKNVSEAVVEKIHQKFDKEEKTAH